MDDDLYVRDIIDITELHFAPSQTHKKKESEHVLRDGETLLYSPIPRFLFEIHQINVRPGNEYF